MLLITQRPRQAGKANTSCSRNTSLILSAVRYTTIALDTGLICDIEYRKVACNASLLQLPTQQLPVNVASSNHVFEVRFEIGSILMSLWWISCPQPFTTFVSLSCTDFVWSVADSLSWALYCAALLSWLLASNRPFDIKDIIVTSLMSFATILTSPLSLWTILTIWTCHVICAESVADGRICVAGILNRYKCGVQQEHVIWFCLIDNHQCCKLRCRVESSLRVRN